MIALVEILERDGRVRRSVPVEAWPVTLGRALDNDVVLDDAHVAAHHARIEAGADGAPEVLALPSVNGLRQGRRPLRAGDRLPLGAGEGQFVAGQTRIRLRLPGEALAPERPLALDRGHALTLMAAFLLWIFSLAQHWVEIDPGTKGTEWVAPLFGVPLVLIGWTLLWTLASKLFQHRLDFWPHLAIAARGALAAEALAFGLALIAGVSGWAWASRIGPAVGLAAVLAIIAAHTMLVLPHLRRWLAGLALASYVGGAAVLLALNQQRLDRWFEELYTATLPPPALRLAAQATPAGFLEATRALEARLQERVREAEAERKESGEADDE